MSDAPMIAAVIGSPVSHSLSPAMYQAAFAANQVVGSYGAVECSGENIGDLITDMNRRGVLGLSVTMPLKEKVISVLDSVDDVASLLNAVNCIVFTNSLTTGYNTDGDGCCDALVEQGGAELLGAKVVVLGAGGTGRSVALGLGIRGADVIVVNRSASNAQQLVSGLQDTVVANGGSICVGSHSDIASSDVVVNTTSVGMNSSVSPVPEGLFHRQQIVLDAVYQPLETAFLADARAAGATLVDGLWMLIYQAQRQCILQFGWKPAVEVMRQAAERELRARQQ